VSQVSGESLLAPEYPEKLDSVDEFLRRRQFSVMAPAAGRILRKRAPRQAGVFEPVYNLLIIIYLYTGIAVAAFGADSPQLPADSPQLPADSPQLPAGGKIRQAEDPKQPKVRNEKMRICCV